MSPSVKLGLYKSPFRETYCRAVFTGCVAFPMTNKLNLVKNALGGLTLIKEF